MTFTLSEKVKQREINNLQHWNIRRLYLTTFGSDKAIQIFNKIMQTFFHIDIYKDENGEYTSDYGNRLIALLSELLLQIRKDLYTKKTKLKRSEMLEFMITDMEQTKEIINEMKL